MSSKVGQQQGRRAFGRLAGRVTATGVVAAAALAAGLTGCASLETRDVTLSESEITLLLARQFPMERKVLEVIDLTVSNPQIRLLPDSNRIGTELDVAAVDRLFGNTAHAHVNLDYGLRFEPSDHSIRMTQVRVRELTLEAGANSMHGVAKNLGTLAAENALENQTLYKMKPAQADAMDRLNLVASPIRVTSQGLSMTVSPKQN